MSQSSPFLPNVGWLYVFYRLGRGDYLYTIAELFGLGVTTVHKIIEEVCEAIIRNLWKPSVQAHFPITKQNIMEKMVDMTAFWQFPCCWGAVDGCHIPIHRIASSGQVLVFQQIHAIPLFSSPRIRGTTLLKTTSYHQFLKSLKVPRFTR